MNVYYKIYLVKIYITGKKNCSIPINITNTATVHLTAAIPLSIFLYGIKTDKCIYLRVLAENEKMYVSNDNIKLNYFHEIISFICDLRSLLLLTKRDFRSTINHAVNFVYI